MLTNNCNHGNCSCCGQCCTDFLFISTAEISTIKKYIKEHHIPEQYAKIKNNSVYMLCPFNDETTHKCLIYSVRPKICRLFKCNQDVHTVETNKKSFSGYINFGGKPLSLHHIFYGNDLQQHVLEYELSLVRKLGGN